MLSYSLGRKIRNFRGLAPPKNFLLKTGTVCKELRASLWAAFPPSCSSASSATSGEPTDQRKAAEDLLPATFRGATRSAATSPGDRLGYDGAAPRAVQLVSQRAISDNSFNGDHRLKTYTVGGRKSETRTTYTKNLWTNQSWKGSFWRTGIFRKNPQRKETFEKRPRDAVFRRCGCFFRIPRIFLMLLAGFLCGFAKSGPISGHFHIFGSIATIIMSRKFQLFVHRRYRKLADTRSAPPLFAALKADTVTRAVKTTWTRLARCSLTTSSTKY